MTNPGAQTLHHEFADTFSGKRVLVTGASGFLGSHLCNALAALGADLHSLSRTPGRGVPGKAHYADVANAARVFAIVATVRPAIIYHLAGLSSARSERTLVLPALEANLLGTVHVLLASAESACTRVLLTASAEEVRAETWKEGVSSPYGASKTAAGIYGRLFWCAYGVPVVQVRPLMAYGPGQHASKLLPYTIGSLLRDEAPQLSACRRVCDFIYVQDVVRGMLRASVAEGVEGLTIDLGSGEGTVTRSVVERLVDLTGARVRPMFGALPDRVEQPMRPADLDAAEKAIGWRPSWSLEQGLAATVAFYRESHRDPESAVGTAHAGQEHRS